MVGGDLTLVRIDAHLGTDGDESTPIAARKILTLDPHMRKDTAQIPLVGTFERLEDLLVLMT